jgi:tRNA threonylcarbamoyladenosine biosynthesis protein TsaB
MILLAFDCSASACSAALRRDGATIAHERRVMERGHAEALVPLIEATLARAGVGFGDLDAVAATVGPGSFTGVRIGLATAHGLALALDIPVLGITTFEAVAHAAAREVGGRSPCLVVLETKRADVYAQLLPAGGGALASPVAAAPAAVAALLPAGPIVLAGDAAARVRPHLDRPDAVFAPGPGSADVADVAELAEAGFAEATERPARPVPLYVSPPGVTRRPDRAARAR